MHNPLQTGLQNEMYERYFVALIPPENVVEKITELKAIACEKFGTCAALKSPPHITLHMPFRWKKKKEKELFSFLEDFTFHETLSTLQLLRFDHFGKRVIFLAVEKNVSLINLQHSLAKEMRKQLGLVNNSYKNQGFHPHLTIAFRDLKKSVFDEAYDYFKGLDICFQYNIDELTLLKHDGKKWEAYRKFSL